MAAPLSFSCHKHSVRNEISMKTGVHTHTHTEAHSLSSACAEDRPQCQGTLRGHFPHTQPPSPPASPPWHPEPLPRGRGGALGHQLSCFCLVHTAGCQKGLSSGTASLESLRQLSSRHSSEHTYATLSQLSSSRVKHRPAAAPRASPASLTLPSPKGASPGGLWKKQATGLHRGRACGMWLPIPGLKSVGNGADCPVGTPLSVPWVPFL